LTLNVREGAWKSQLPRFGELDNISLQPSIGSKNIFGNNFVNKKSKFGLPLKFEQRFCAHD